MMLTKRQIDILAVAAKRGASAIEIAEELGVTRQCVHPYLVKMIDGGYIHQDARGEPYRATPRGRAALALVQAMEHV